MTFPCVWVLQHSRANYNGVTIEDSALASLSLSGLTGSQVGAWANPIAIVAFGQAGLAHLIKLTSRRHLLGHQSCLDSMEQSFEPTHQLRLGDPQL